MFLRKCLRAMLSGLLALIAVMPLAVWGSPADKAGTLSGDPLSSAEVSSRRSAYDSFLKTAETLYRAVNEGDMQAALDSLKVMERRLLDLPMTGVTSVEGLQALATDFSQMKRTAAAIKPDQRKWEEGAASLRLAADALAHPDNPLWHRYRAVMKEQLSLLEQAIGAAEPSAASVSGRPDLEALDQVGGSYRVIRTAALLTSSPEAVDRSDSVLRYADKVLRAEPVNRKLAAEALGPLREAIEALFPASKETTVPVPPFAAPPWGWTAMMGSFIVTVLTWVGWLRYRIDRNALPGSRSAGPERKDAAERFLNRRKKK